MSELERIQVRIAHIIYHDESSAYTVARFRLIETDDKLITATGYFINLQKDVVYELVGDYVDHPRFGVQLNVHRYHRVLPTDPSSLIKFLASPLFPGVGKRFAQTIVETWGEDSLRMLKHQPEALSSLKGYSVAKQDALLKGLETFGEDEAALAFFTSHGFSLKHIQKLDRIYGADAYDLIKENPYRMVYEVDGIGFKTADKLALSMGFDVNDARRLEAALYAMVAETLMKTGNTYLDEADVLDLYERNFGDLGVEAWSVLQACLKRGVLAERTGRIYTPAQIDAEITVAAWVHHFPYLTLEAHDDKDLQHHLNRLQNTLGLRYDEAQLDALQGFFNHPWMILTGGPGTGKSTVIGAMIQLFKQLYPAHSLACVAPTGRAARRLTELNGVESSTIHALLKWDLESNRFGINEANPLTIDCLIIDEFSMVDAHVFAALIKAAHPVKKLVLVGDYDQLPSVAPGQMLNDLLELKIIPSYELKRIYRQQAGSDVIELAHQMRSGQVDFTNFTQDVRWLPCSSVEVKSHLLRQIDDAIEKGYSIQDIQVLSPMYSGYAGIDALNHAIQKHINPSDSRKRELRVGPMIFREYDKILQLKNVSDQDVSNGDIGRLIEIVYAHEDSAKKNRLRVDFDGRLVEYSPETFSHITLAYCISIHKAQGSEYPIVMLPIVPEHHFMHDRRLLYTAISRASRELVLLGEPERFSTAILTLERAQRRSGVIDIVQSLRVS
jgi:exodeoxyribonuclease V alpha subunit